MAIILRPLMMLLLLVMAFGLSRLLHRVIPDGKVKEFLYKKHFVVPPKTARR